MSLSQKPTQRQLAELMGVSQMTVSRVLNNSEGVSAKLRKRILRKIEKHGYLRNRIASGLRGKSTRTIGLIVPDISSSFFPEIAASIERGASEKGYHVILAQNYESTERESREIKLLQSFYVDGMIIAPAGGQTEIEAYKQLQKLRMPFVFIDRFKEKIKSNYVVTDIKTGAFTLGRYLLKKGYQRWGYLRGPKGVSSSDEHYSGLCESLKEAGKKRNHITPVPAGFGEAAGFEAVGALLDTAKPDVIIASNDSVAMGAYRYLKKHKVRVPKDVGLVGFSDLKTTDILEVPLTTVKEPTAQIGRKALDILMDQIADPKQPVRTERLAPKLIIRKSA
jgi:LacI family transcriptional regulator